MSFYVSTATFFLLHCDEWDRVVALPRHKFVTGATLLQLAAAILMGEENEKVRGKRVRTNSTGKKEGEKIREKIYGKIVRGKKVREKKYGKKYGEKSTRKKSKGGKSRDFR